MGKMKKSKMYHTLSKLNKPIRKYLSSETNYSQDESKSEGSGYYDGKKVIIHSKKITKKNEEIFIDQIQDSTGESISLNEDHYKYDSNGNLINLTTIENGEVSNEEFYKYDNKNQQVLQFTKDLEGNEYVTEIIYDELGRETEIIFRVNNEVDVKVMYQYKGDNKNVVETVYDSRMKLLSKSISYFDIEKNPIYLVNYDSDGNVTSTSLYVYTGNKLLEFALFDKNQIIEERTSYKHYENTELLQQQINEYYSGGKIEKKDIYEWEYEFYDE